MTFEVDEKKEMLFKDAAEAIRNQDWEAVNQVACYDDEMGNYMLTIYEVLASGDFNHSASVYFDQ